MASFVLNEWINASPELVFELMTNPERVSEVNPKVVQMEMTTEGSLQKGSRFLEKRVVDGQEAQTELLVENIERPNLYAVSAEQSGIKVLYTYELNAENGGTNIRLTCDVSSGGLKKLMLPVVASIMKREDGNHLVNLKEVVESTALG